MKSIILKGLMVISVLLIGTGLYLSVNKPTVKEYTVTFNTDGDTYIAPLKVKEGDVVKEPAAPNKTGYLFITWQCDGSDYDFNDKVHSDLTLTAIWVPVDNNGN